MLGPASLAPLDDRSFGLGMIYAFAEVVASGCKPMAYSPPLEPGDLAPMLAGAQEIGKEYGVVVRHDAGFTPTLLFNPAFTAGKEVIVLAASPEVLDRYLALQARQQQGPGHLDEQAFREQVARELGELLGYSSQVIDDLLVNPRF